jgi:predicted nucleic acid-binding protein
VKLVIDTSIVFSLFKSDSSTNRILKEHKLKLIAPRELIEELSKYSDLICSKSNITKEKFLEDINSLSELIELKNASKSFEIKVKKSITHESDVPFLALASELKIPIWSNDSHFKEQHSIIVFTTKELQEFLQTN